MHIRTLLTNWYASPPASSESVDILFNRNMQLRTQRGLQPFMLVMQQMISAWWEDAQQASFPDKGMHYANTRRKLALYQLVAGQLLISCKLSTAMDYLDMGLRHADGLLSSEDYFLLYNRHEELRFLRLSAERQKPRSLSELLNESRVMRKLRPKTRYSIPRQS